MEYRISVALDEADIEVILATQTISNGEKF